MITTSLLIGSVLVGATWALEALSLSESSKLLLLGVILLGVALWSRRYRKQRENS
jgi:LPXTG-motif cell wall-anchored protein